MSSLLDVAMAGTQRREIPGALPAFDNLPPESRLLRGASYEGLRRLAGRPPDPVENVIAVEPCGPETRPGVPALAGARLVEILTDRPGLLLEWLGLAAGGGWRISHDCLPDVLDYARSHPDVHDLASDDVRRCLRSLHRRYPAAVRRVGRGIWRVDVPLFVARAGRDEMPRLNETLDAFLTKAVARNLPITFANHPTGPHAFDLFDDLDHLGPWIVRTLQRVTDKTHGSPGAYYQPRIPQFAKLGSA